MLARKFLFLTPWRNSNFFGGWSDLQVSLSEIFYDCCFLVQGQNKTIKKLGNPGFGWFFFTFIKWRRCCSCPANGFHVCWHSSRLQSLTIYFSLSLFISRYLCISLSVSHSHSFRCDTLSPSLSLSLFLSTLNSFSFIHFWDHPTHSLSLSLSLSLFRTK